ncbi:hypothetical protein DICPUDRAFT_156207 [Dictyostelium purpureum]|uniref:Uncharacterized protein n=1 Tax=Dictyostelium purpureum TaxID=5786 RepID=F0ZW00_DICPU|nr:uncharacterized protein DICPUDRAFT_156207 [Dictyostelium purpureum]EGC31893.1 hypothetical protein DICPUDRAFT_156207 [Dictyostelium purpureum]|eukprot:XP_003291594.1 hypothetical protein DICPUDRAFT_156207 [Dictyostelium purpureum]
MSSLDYKLDDSEEINTTLESPIENITPTNNIPVEEEQTCQKTFVKEAPELKLLISKLINLEYNNKNEIINNCSRITNIIDQYLEQSNLLDVHLNDFIQPLINFIKINYINNNNNNDDQLQKDNNNNNNYDNNNKLKLSIKFSFKIIYVLSKVRGYKTIVKLFQHEAMDLMPVLNQLEISFKEWIEVNKKRSRLNEISVNYSSGYIIKPNENDLEMGINNSKSHNNNENNNENDNENNENSNIGSTNELNYNNNNLEEDEYNENIMSWEEVYVLSLWVSLLVIIPFKFSSIDSMSGTLKGISSRILKLGTLALQENSKIRDSFTELLSKLLTRPDMINEQKQFIQSSIESINQVLKNETFDNNEISLTVGIYGTLASIFKKGNRKDFLPFNMDLYKIVMKANQELSSSGSERIAKKIFLKLIQRIAIIMLPPVSASWRYQKIIKPLLLKSNLAVKQISSKQDEQDNIEDDDQEIPEEIDEIIEEILNSLRDKDTIIRWTGAKAIGRIVNLLPKDMGDQIIGLVIDMFEKDERLDADPSSWHGGCLALAELARRGLLLPERLDAVVPLVIRALFFDIIKGTYSVGSHVRDSACYLCWALARTYHNSILSPFLLTICQNLVVTSIYDREINCRKSASAAYQEMVGRHQGLVPHGIDIVTTADFFAVGNKKNSYTNLTAYIGKYPEYYGTMIDHLSKIKIYNWDLEIRELASKAIYILTNINPTDIVNNYLPIIIPSTQSELIHVKHGASITISKILQSLKDNNKTNILTDKLKSNILNTIKNTKNEKLFKGKGGVLIRIGMCRLIYSICLVEFQLEKDLSIKDDEESNQQANSNSPNDRQAALKAKIAALKAKTAQINKTVQPSKQIAKQVASSAISSSSSSNIAFNIIIHYLSENLNHPNEDVQKEATKAFSQLFKIYMCSTQDKKKSLLQFIDSHCKTIKIDPNRSARRGSALVLGALPFKEASFTNEYLDRIIDSLIYSVFEEDPLFRDIETRVNALISLEHIGNYLLSELFKQQQEQQESSEIKDKFIKIWNCFGKATNDYSIDKRGDIGSWVRELSCKILFNFVKLINQNYSIEKLITEKMITEFISKLIQLSGEKLDKIRDVVCKIIHQILWMEPTIKTIIPHREELLKIFVKVPDDHFNWFRTEESLPLICLILQFDIYLYPLLFGLFSSLGGNSKYLIDDSINSINNYFNNYKNEEKENKIIKFLQTVLEISQNVPERMVQPTFKSITNLLLTHHFDFIITTKDKSILERILFICYERIKASHDDIYLLLNSVDLFSYFFLELEKFKIEYIEFTSLKSLLLLISNLKFPKVRKLASIQLIKSNKIIDPEITIAAKEILNETRWDDPVEVIIEPLKKLLYLLDPKKEILDLISEHPTPKPINLELSKTIQMQEEEKIKQIEKEKEELNRQYHIDDYLPENTEDLMEI